MVRKAVGRISREMNRETVDYRGPKTASGARFRNPRRISAPRYTGTGFYRERAVQEEEDI